MLRRPSSQTPLYGVLDEHECPRCHRPGRYPLGVLCAECRAAIARRAGRVARWVAAAATVAVAAYVWVRLPDSPLPVQRFVSVVSVVIWYLLTFLVTKRILIQYWQ